MRKSLASIATGLSDRVKALPQIPNSCRLTILFTTGLLAIGLVVSPLNAQLYTGSVAGTVSDPSGAVIQGAQVTLVDSNKGYDFKGTTDDSGRYLFRQVPPGTYAVSVEAKNFQPQRKEGVSLSINQNASVDFSLKVGAAAQTVDVTAVGLELQTQDAVTGQVVDRNLINNLPLINRQVFDLAFLAPGVTIADEQCVGCTATNFISNGSRNSTADVVIDGVTTSNFEQNSGIMSATYTPSVEAVEEFKVQQSNFSAEFGFTGSSIVNVVTRSGTNSYHGSVYEFLRNDKLDANDWFANHFGDARSPLRQNNFGATFGGPIRKNKTFFFVDYDGTRTRSFASASSGVPSAAERVGDFSELCTLRGASFDPNGQCTDPAGQLWDPFKGAHFDSDEGGPVRTVFIKNNDLAAGELSDGTTDLNLIDPVASQLMQFFPAPTQEVTDADGRFNNWFRSGTNKFSDNKFDVKIDHRFSERNLLSGKFSYETGNSHSFNCYDNEADNCTGGPVDFHRYLVAINDTYTFGPSVVMNLSYGYTRGFDFQRGIIGDFPEIDPVSQLGMPSYMNRSGFPQFPNVVLADYVGPGDANIGTQTFSILRQGQDTHHVVGTLSWLRGSHELKFGGELRAHRINFAQPGWPAGSFTFDYTGTSENPDVGGDPMASFLMGVGPGAGCDFCPYEVPNSVSTQNFQFGGFVQDNWRVSPKLTLNLGLRYDVSLPRTERENRQNWIDLNMTNPLNGGSVTYDDILTGNPVTLNLRGGEVFASPNNRYNFGIDWKNIQPRFGFAYQIHPSVVIRGGYGIFYSTTRAGAAGTGPINTYKGYDQLTQWLSVDPTDGFSPFARFSDPFPGGGPLLPPGNSLGALNDVGFDGGGNVKSITHTPYEQSWSFGFETELTKNLILDLSYVGKKGTHLYFSGASELNHLPISVESLSPAEIGNLLITDQNNPFFGIITDPNSELSGETVSRFQVMRPYPQYTSLAGDTFPIASSIYHALQIRAEKAYKNGLQFLVTYTWSKSIDDSSSTDDSVTWLGGFSSLQDPNRRDLERSVSTFDVPHVLQFSYVYDLPVGRGRAIGGGMNSVANAVLGGWQLNGTFRFSSGRPVFLTLDSGEAIPTYGGRRPNLTGTLARNDSHNDWVSEDGSVSYFGNANQVIAEAPDFTIGNAPRALSNIRQPGVNNATMSFFKQVSLAKLREGSRLEFRVEAFNAFNHPQFCGPDTSVRFVDDPDTGDRVIETGSFGKVTSTCNSAREVQLGLKLYW